MSKMGKDNQFAPVMCLDPSLAIHHLNIPEEAKVHQ